MRNVSLSDKYAPCSGLAYMTGLQALVRIALDRQRLDRRAGLRTAGFISGYRGSPLATLDLELERVADLLATHDIVFRPGVNEELAATAVWGTQQVGLFPGARFDGVFGLWYGKAPGVDRSVDAFRHGNFSGTAPRGGVLLVAGDDHDRKSSTLPTQSEFVFQSLEIPVVNPANVQDVLDLGLHALELSRHAGLFVGMIALADTMDSSAVVRTELDRLCFHRAPPEAPAGGLHIRLEDDSLDQERRIRGAKLAAAARYAVENGLNCVVAPSGAPRALVAATGKSYADLLLALDALGHDPGSLARAGVGILKIGLSWPLDHAWLRATCAGFRRVIVIEEKRAFVETQLAEALYPLPDAHRPQLWGKRTPAGAPFFADTGALQASDIASALAEALPWLRNKPGDRYLDRVAAHRQVQERHRLASRRRPFFCAGCPHNKSTRLPDGARALPGIGCHFLVQWMDRSTKLTSQMGGEGAHWIGQAPFTDERHVYANIGDGTYYHSGYLAIRAAIAAKVNVTFKLLYNDAVAMTGGQTVDGPLSVSAVVRQLRAEGVQRIEIVTDDPGRPRAALGRETVPVHHRSRLQAVQRSMRETPGVSVLIYDEACATKRRRLRRRGLAPPAAERLFINHLVCEGCGDCTAKSSCIAVEPLATEFGHKRRINQSACNQDASCREGFCPSFVGVVGGRLRRGVARERLRALDEPPQPQPGERARIVIAGIGGIGVTTLSAVLGMAAFLGGRAVAVLDQNGMAQKGGAVLSTVTLAPAGEGPAGSRIPEASASLLIGADVVAASAVGCRYYLSAESTVALVNTRVAPTGDFVELGAEKTDPEALWAAVTEAAKVIVRMDAGALAEQIFGDEIFVGALLLGRAYQMGLVPLPADAIRRAFELNGASVEDNLLAFKVGRLSAHAPELVSTLAASDRDERRAPAAVLADAIERRRSFLEAYQNESYAARYAAHVARALSIERQVMGAAGALGVAVARSLFKLMAYKDEYEVARLYSGPEFRRDLAETFEGDYRLKLHLAPPLLARRDPATGEPRKMAFGSWLLPVLRGLASLRFLRGTVFDPFGWTRERRAERAEIRAYEGLLVDVLPRLTRENHALVTALASVPEGVKGYGHVKARALAAASERRTALLAALEASRPAPPHAATAERRSA